MTPDQLRELADRLSRNADELDLEPCDPSLEVRISDLRAAAANLRAQADARPVAYKHTESDGGMAYFVADEAPCEKCVPLYAAPVPPQREPAHDIPLFDFDAEAWKQVLAAARDSKWMPAEYAMNDWLADICQWLRDGPPAGEQREPLSDERIAEITKKAARRSALRHDRSTSARIARAVERAHGIGGSDER